jgi:hypothetical protein
MDIVFLYQGQRFVWDLEKGNMKMSERIKKRLRKDRTMTTISMRLPEDVIEDLKEIAPALGFSGYQPLIRAYIGQGLRKDLARMEKSKVQILMDSLRRHGVKDEVISEAIAEARSATQPPLRMTIVLHEGCGDVLSKNKAGDYQSRIVTFTG